MYTTSKIFSIMTNLTLHIISLIALASVASAAQAQIKTSVIADTTRTVTYSDDLYRMVITESASGLKVTSTCETDSAEQTIFFKPYDSDVSITSTQGTRSIKAFDKNINSIISLNSETETERHHWWDVVSGGWAVGLVNPTAQPSGFGLQWSKSFEISWLNVLAVKYGYRSMAFSLGVGIDWRNYRMSGGDMRMAINDEGGVGLAPYPEGCVPGFSRIKVFSIGLPLLYSQRIAHRTYLQAGAIVNFNTHASLLTKYTSPEGNAMSVSTNSIHHRRVTLDYFGSITHRGIGLYARYSPHNVLMGHGSPRINPLSVGIILFTP